MHSAHHCLRNAAKKRGNTCGLGILFSSNHNIHKSSYSLCLIDSTKIYQLKGLKPKSKGHTNFYECCDLTKKVYLVSISI